MRRIAGRQLWIGHAGDLRDARAILDAGIAAVVELADSEPHAVLPRDLIRCRFPLSDDGNNPPWLIRLAARSVAELLQAGVPILVCCSAGMSRSVCIAGAVFFQGDEFVPSDRSQGLIDQWFGPEQVVVLQHAFGDAFVDKLTGGVVHRRELAAFDMGFQPRLLLGREVDCHARHCA